MSEKKQVLYDLRTSYSGPFVVEDFYSEIDTWAREKGFDKEQKKKLEYVTKNGKRIQYVAEIKSHLDENHHGVLQLKVIADNVKEVIIKREGKKLRINNGDLLMTLDGFVEGHLAGSFYQMRPGFYFMRALIDKFIFGFWSDKFDGIVNSDGRELFKRLGAFFRLQNYKYQ